MQPVFFSAGVQARTKGFYELHDNDQYLLFPQVLIKARTNMRECADIPVCTYDRSTNFYSAPSQPGTGELTLHPAIKVAVSYAGFCFFFPLCFRKPLFQQGSGHFRGGGFNFHSFEGRYLGLHQRASHILPKRWIHLWHAWSLCELFCFSVFSLPFPLPLPLPWPFCCLTYLAMYIPLPSS